MVFIGQKKGMYQVQINQVTKDKTQTVFSVVVKKDEHETHHTVHLKQKTYERLAKGKSPKRLIDVAFRFLLARESNAAILPEFSIKDINRYFPSFEKAILNDQP